jgi:hypothetical protein
MYLIYKLICLIVIPWIIGYCYSKIVTHDFPYIKTINNNNEEIENRSDNKNVLHIFIYAFISGIALCLSFNKKNNFNIINLIGIGIGCSLLPPIVNSGMLYSRNTKLDNIKSMNSFKLFIINMGGLFSGVLILLILKMIFK